MNREDHADLNGFVVVAEEQSFTRAAAKLGTSQSALSYTVRRLEARLGVRLLTRTTRRVAPTGAGEQLLNTLRPALNSIAGELALLGEMRERPAGSIRISTSAQAATQVLWPALNRLLPRYPDIRVELNIDARLTDRGRTLRCGCTARRASGARRRGRQDWPGPAHGRGRRALVFSSASSPRTPQDLAEHQCINLRLPRPPWPVSAWPARRKADLAAKAELRVLEDWCPPFSGYHLYYPSPRQPSAAFTLLVKALKYRG